MDEYIDGGILGALTILKDHWGAVGRDLAWAGYQWDDICDRLPFSQFIDMVTFSPPGTGLYYALHRGWTPEMYKLTNLEDLVAWIQWSKSTAAEENPSSPPKPQWRPGDPTPDDQAAMTIGDYMRLSGYFNDETEGTDD